MKYEQAYHVLILVQLLTGRNPFKEFITIEGWQMILIPTSGWQIWISTDGWKMILIPTGGWQVILIPTGGWQDGWQVILIPTEFISSG